MNIEETKKAIEVMQAFVDGKPCEWKFEHIGPWDRVFRPTWDWHKHDYRIKPEPKEIWVNEYDDGSASAYNSEDKALYAYNDGATRKAVRYREVIEE